MTAAAPPPDSLAVLRTTLAAIDGQADFFAILQVPRNAEPMQIRDAYFRLAKVLHPDLPQFVSNPQLRNEATRAFQAITSANQTLADPTRRRSYMQTLMQAAMDRSEQIVAQVQGGNRPSQPTPTPSSLRATGPQVTAIDVVTGPVTTSRPTVPRQPGAEPAGGTGPMAPTATNRAMVGGYASTTGQFTRPLVNAANTAPNPVVAGGFVGSNTGQFSRPLAPGARTMDPVTAPVQPQQAKVLRGLEPPPNAEVARIYLHSGRQQMGRRDWPGAQEALELALPLLEGKESADCKVMLGWAIFNNNQNSEMDRIERPKAMWNEVSVQQAKTQFHAQAAYYLAIWHKLHGEMRHVMSNLHVCLELQPNHIEAAREKRLLEQRRGNLAELQELDDRLRNKPRRPSATVIPQSRPTPSAKKIALQKEPTWLEKLFGGDKK